MGWLLREIYTRRALKTEQGANRIELVPGGEGCQSNFL